MSQPARGRILLSLTGQDVDHWRRLLGRGYEVVTERSFPSDPSIDYAVVWKHEAGVLAGLPNLRLVVSTGAGVDHIFADEDLPDVPILRVVAENLATHMAEYVVWRVMDHHRQGATYRAQQAGKVWREPPQPTAAAVAVGIMGPAQRIVAAKAAQEVVVDDALGRRRVGQEHDENVRRRQERPQPVAAVEGRHPLDRARGAR
ncbi:MAG: hypothetical protein IH590_13210, partial [Aquamicrobium sp.]|nr:hypothetical protein [Aquamicrobium sp.]